MITQKSVVHVQQISEHSLIFSVLLVVRNEEKYLSDLLNSVLNQDFSDEKYEIIIVDGQSTDRTPDIIQSFVQQYPDRITALQNERQTLPTGWNAGIREAAGKYVLRLDGHSQIPQNFLRETYNVIEKVPQATCVGGVIRTVGNGVQGEINAFVYSHPLGVGNSKFRITDTVWEGYVDTVPYGAYERQIFAEVGGFDESLKRNEDLEMHARIRNRGGSFYLSTTIQSVYYVRDNVHEFVKKSFQDGKWTFIAGKRVKGTLRIRHTVPLFTVLGGIILTVGGLFQPLLLKLLFVLVLLYMLLVGRASWSYARENGPRFLFRTMCTFFMLHVSRGIGSLSSFFSPHFWEVGRKS
jgi:glycosyltransferase involved in cell wall biosynthesis